MRVDGIAAQAIIYWYGSRKRQFTAASSPRRRGTMYSQRGLQLGSRLRGDDAAEGRQTPQRKYTDDANIIGRSPGSAGEAVAV